MKPAGPFAVPNSWEVTAAIQFVLTLWIGRLLKNSLNRRNSTYLLHQCRFSTSIEGLQFQKVSKVGVNCEQNLLLTIVQASVITFAKSLHRYAIAKSEELEIASVQRNNTDNFE